MHKLEGKTDPVETVQEKHALIVDAMAYVQQSKTANKTFGEFSFDLLQRILAVSYKASQIDVVFDKYLDDSIKNVERNRRGSGRQLLFNTIVSSAPIKQWSLFLSCNENKIVLIKSIVSEWKQEKYLTEIGDKDFYVTDGEQIFKLHPNEVTAIQELFSNHEEADTRMILHAKHAYSTCSKVIISSPDTDYFVICLSMHQVIHGNLYFLTGVKNNRRIIDVSEVD